MATLNVLLATIAAGQSLSAGIDCGAGLLVRLYMPSAWTPANVTFQLSPDNITYYDMYDAVGREMMLAVRPGAGIVAALQWRSLAWIKFRSGTAAKPVVQAAARQFKLIIERL